MRILFLGALLFAGLVVADEGPRQDGPRDEGRPAAEGARDAAPPRDQLPRKTRRIFAAYDKDKDAKVTFAEWCKMKEGAMDDARRERERTWFGQADANNNGSLTVAEFHKWLNRKPGREGNNRGPRDGEGKQRGPRDGDRPRAE